jgi:Uma2 family endonuclease
MVAARPSPVLREFLKSRANGVQGEPQVTLTPKGLPGAGFPPASLSSYPGIVQVLLPDTETTSPIRIQVERRLNDDEFWDFCAQNADLRIEREANGDLIIMPPAGAETGFRNSDLNAQLATWAKQDGRGRVFDSNTEYILPDGAALSPDASWVSTERLDKFSKQQKKRFLALCPDFLVELTSPTDRLPRVKAKMEQWMSNGARLGWLIDADRQTVYIYRSAQQPEPLTGVDHVLGEGPVDGFRLELSAIWRGL